MTRSASAGTELPAGPASPAAVSSEPDCSRTPDDPRCSATPAPPAGSEVEFGIGVRLRSVWLPRSVLELFLERAAGGAQNYGVGVELTRRHGTTELQLGFEYEHVNVGQGVWINRGEDVATGDEADYVLGPNSRTGSGHQFGWFTIEFTFFNHAEITRWLSLRYGGGLGLGIFTGELDHYNIICKGATNAAPEPGCVPERFGGAGEYSDGGATPTAYDLPPVFPVINAIVGLQFKPSDELTINLEGGVRTLPFVGVSSSVFF